jgi:spore protease
MNRTDLALEIIENHSSDGVHLKKSLINNLLLTEITLENGHYATLHCGGDSVQCPNINEKLEIEALTEVLGNFIPKTGKILVAGLGNANITPDSLGVRTASKVIATAHFSENEEFYDLDMREVYVVETGVLAQTGMESSEQLRYIADGIKPDMAVVIDSLVCTEPERLGRTIQITDTGIAPGSGVGNLRREISRKTLGIPVVAIGTPTVIDLSSLAPKIGKTYEAMVVPRNIDTIIFHFAKVISKALNNVLIPTLTEEEAERLRF